VSRSYSALAAAGFGAALCILSGASAAIAEPASTATACAKADLALMHKLADEHGTSAAAPARLVRASMTMIDARAACGQGDYAGGLVLYSDAEALAAPQSSAMR
jgi:hypothetical protein